MTSELQHLKQKIRRLEAGGEPNLALRREYNAKLQAHRDGEAHPSGGGNRARIQELEQRVQGLEETVTILRTKPTKEYVHQYVKHIVVNSVKREFKDEREEIIRFIAKEIVKRECLQDK